MRATVAAANPRCNSLIAGAHATSAELSDQLINTAFLRFPLGVLIERELFRAFIRRSRLNEASHLPI
jgi:hypothetical protein